MQEQIRSPRAGANQAPEKIQFQTGKICDACVGLCPKKHAASPLLSLSDKRQYWCFGV